MKPWINLATANVPGGTTPLRLKQRGDEFSIMLGSNELMNSRLSGSEQALAELVSTRIQHSRRPRILIGGLGMGFTLRAALKCFPQEAEIIVAELVPEVIDWARGPLAPIFQNCLDDPRVEIGNADVASLITTDEIRYDAILLDVDNGPEGLSREQNDRLYGLSGLKAAHAALKPLGVLAVWSSGPSPDFTRRLRSTGFTTEEATARATTNKRGARHTIWLATKPG